MRKFFKKSLKSSLYMAIVYMAITFMITLLYHISPLIWEVRRLEICRPAASSLALLIRRPEESLWNEVLSARVALASSHWYSHIRPFIYPISSTNLDTILGTNALFKAINSEV